MKCPKCKKGDKKGDGSVFLTTEEVEKNLKDRYPRRCVLVMGKLLLLFLC
jgi:hypothetical protein